MPEIVASNVSVQRAALAYMGSGASAAALRRVSSGPASPLGGRPEVPRVRRDADTFAPLPRAPAAPPQRRAWASSASAASERTRVGSKQELESALASAQAALQAATERVAVSYSFNELTPTGKVNASTQIGRVKPGDANGTHWQVKPLIGWFRVPVWLDYYIVDVDTENYSWIIAAAPSGWWIYIMTREKVVGDAALAPHLEFLKSKGVNLSKVTRFNQGQ